MAAKFEARSGGPAAREIFEKLSLLPLACRIDEVFWPEFPNESPPS